jgi:hypothetical protein
VRTLMLGGIVLLALAAASSAVAADAPRATLAKKADAICAADNAKLVKFKNTPPASDFLFSYTPKQLKASAGYWVEVQALAKQETAAIFALGTPTEPAARVMWNRWKVLSTTYGLPFMATVVRAAQQGDVNGMRAVFSKGDKQDAEAVKLLKKLGIKVCEFI